MPLLRDGEKGENVWKEISWDEAFDLIAEKLEDAIDTIGNQEISFHAFSPFSPSRSSGMVRRSEEFSHPIRDMPIMPPEGKDCSFEST